MTILKVGAVLLASIVVQLTVFVDVRVADVAPELLALVAVLAGLLAGPERGATVAFGAGLLWDVWLPTPLGLAAMAFATVAFVIGSIGAIAILWFGLARKDGITFTGLVDFVTITSFIAAPLLAIFNHRCVFSSEILAGDRPARVWWIWSWIGIVVLSGFAGAYAVGRLVG